ncbi:putative Sensor histidine kinase FleS [Nitrospina gracilis 3/211]|uniref:histidine kinase n=2 Tax=Nitrospinaceae TaxID=407032 RepID=M1YXZ6_NITG3|nr:putative Sensor histidine kinase FleS [Nitrospina gracilis 3/211]
MNKTLQAVRKLPLEWPMTDEPQDRQVPDLETLQAAFQAFTETTQHLQESYEKLQAHVRALDLELEKKNAELEQNLKEKEAVRSYLDNILQSLTTGVIVVDDAQRITTFNKTAERITGLKENAVQRKTLGEVFDVDPFAQLIARVNDTPNAQPVFQESVLTTDGRDLRLRTAASPVLDAQGARIGTMLLVEDITELKRLEEEAERNDRLRAMGEMAAGIAHEIRNPLASIELFASLLKKDLGDDEEKRAPADHIINGVRNMDRTISSLLLFAKSPEPSRSQCDLNTLFENLLADPSQLQVPDNVNVVCDFGAGTMTANADEHLLKQVFLNFLRNAVQAMPVGGTLTIQTERGAAPAGETFHRHFIRTTIADTGVGIAQSDQKHIFNPFFSTKEKGTGLGLAIAHNIIKAHHGTIDVDSQPGRGTTFTINLPGSDTPAS